MHFMKTLVTRKVKRGVQFIRICFDYQPVVLVNLVPFWTSTT